MTNTTKRIINRYKNIQGRRLFILIALIVVAISVLGTYLLADNASTRHQQDFELKLDTQANSLSNLIGDNSKKYEQLLLTADSVFDIKGYNNVTRADWHELSMNLKLEANFPEVLGLGYAQYIRLDQKVDFINSIKKEGFNDFNIEPSTDRNEYTAIKFIEPFNTTNKKAFGYDMFTEPTRAKAMANARDKAEMSVSDSVVLVQDENGTTSQPPQSVLIYYPVYSGGIPPENVSKRRQELVGYVYIAVRIQDMIAPKITELNTSGTKFNLFNLSGSGSIDSLYMFKSANFSQNQPTKSNEQAVSFLNQRWSINTQINDKDKYKNSLMIFVLGLFTSVLLGLSVYWILGRLMHKTRREHREELKRTKDELLALTSHQLRTPATAVRQYVGMLKDGYIGEIPKEQLDILTKAYKANDRQLEIIDQILYVAKADAGQLALSYAEFDLAKLTKDLIDSMKSQSVAKNITINQKLPKKLIIKADQRYIIMVIENLINNAIKYSYNNSQIDIKLSKKDDKAIFIVKDIGVGINDEDQDRLFKKFVRINNPLSITEGGTGLGLFLVKRLTKAHKGTVNVISEEGKGSSFILELPINPKNHQNVIQLTESTNKH